MKQLLLLLTFFILLNNCNTVKPELDYRDEMRTFVVEIASFARDQDPDFIVIPQNGHELLTKNEQIASDYVSTIDGLGQESLFFGYPTDDVSTPDEDQYYLLNNLSIGKRNDKTILITDYASSDSNIVRSKESNSLRGYISFVAPSRELDVIPDIPIRNENTNNIRKLSEAKNFLYLLNYVDFDTKDALIDAISATNYDALIIDAFWGRDMFTATDIEELKQKANGGQRLVISYMSIGEAEDYRFYWEDSWDKTELAWIESENPNWPGNFKVKYWNKDWQQLIYGSKNSYTQKIINAGFDGVYLDIIDAFWYFENKVKNN
jgi:cysteinyl-tRNA synthetase